MNNKTNVSNIDELKEPSKIGASKFDYELYHEEDDIIERIFRVKRLGNDDKERWRIFENSTNTFTIEINQLSKKQAAYLRTSEGMTFLLQQYKIGARTITKIKVNVQNRLNELDK